MNSSSKNSPLKNSPSKFLTAIPLLPALDLSETIAFYEQRFGFNTDFQYEDYIAVRRGGVQIHLWRCDNRQIAENTSCRITVTDIEQLYQEYQAQNVIHQNGSLAVKPWGLREFTALDLNGNTLIFAEPIAATRQRDRTD